LGNWVDKIRQQMRTRFEAEAEGNTNSATHHLLTKERINRLNSIGFVWSQFDHAWNIRFEELKEYKVEHGDTLVPVEWPQNVPLAQWVLKHRRSYKLLQKAAPRADLNENMKSQTKENESILSVDRIEKLNEIDFVWDVHRHQWFKSLEELKVYISDHGDALVPNNCPSHPILGRWVDKQRIDYRRYMEKKKMDEEWGGWKDIWEVETNQEMKRVSRLWTAMTEEKIRLLEAEGFIWSVVDYWWDSKYDELCSFVALNGHCAVFTNSTGPYNSLARWAEAQRRDYRKYKDGKKTVLTEDRIKRLNAVNFMWEKQTKCKQAESQAA